MADYFENDAGQMFVKNPATEEAVPIEARDIARIEQGGLAAFFGAAARGMETIGQGASAPMGNEAGQARFDELERQGGVVGEMSPVANLGQYAPDVVAGIASGGSTIPSSIARGAAVEAALGAVRNPDAPVQGALIQGAVGGVTGGAGVLAARGATRLAERAGIRASVSSSFNRSAQNTVMDARRSGRAATMIDDGIAELAPDGSLHAARNADPNFRELPQGQRVLKGFGHVERLDDLADRYGIKGGVTTKGDALALNSRNAEQTNAADLVRGKEEVFRSDVITDRIAGRGKSIEGIRQNQRDLAGKRILDELGLSPDTRFTDDVAIEAREAIGGEFDAVAQRAGPLKIDADDMGRIDDAVREGGAQDAASLSKTAADLKADIETASEAMGKAGELSPKAARNWRANLGRKITTAVNTDNLDKAEALQGMMDTLDEVVERQIPDEVAEQLYEARYKYRIMLAMERANATNKGGEINTGNVLNSLTKGANKFGQSFKRGTRSERAANAARAAQGIEPEMTKGGQFMQDMETLAFLNEKVAPDSGTATRILSAVGSNKAAGAGGLLAAAQYGLSD